MAISDPYVTADELAEYLGIGDADDNGLLSAAAGAASQWVSRWCGRQFNKVTVASARTYEPSTTTQVIVDDFHTLNDLEVRVDTGNDGTFATTVTDFVVKPVNGIVDGEPGFPFWKIELSSGRFPCTTRPTVQVSAHWGWAEVPESVKRATLIVAAMIHNLKDSPLGVASFADAGIIRLRDIPQVVPMLLERYRHPRSTAVVA